MNGGGSAASSVGSGGGGANDQMQQQQQQHSQQRDGHDGSQGEEESKPSTSSHQVIQPVTKASTSAGQRSRTACVNCRATKQKCDGPSRVPCRRCELYNLECGYTEPAPRLAVKRKADDDGIPPPPPQQVRVQPTTGTHFNGDIASTILARLDEITHRTSMVEDYLRVLPQALNTRTAPALPSLGELALPDSIPGYRPEQASIVRTGNPMSTITESFQGLQGNEQTGNAYMSSRDNGPPTQEMMQNGYPYQINPQSQWTDAVSRGLITVEQAQRYFNFFIDHCRWWVHGFVPQQFSDPMRIRHTCPLLFGAVICVSSYYLDAPNGDVGLQLYLSLVALVNETLAPTIMSPRNAELDVDFILGVALCIVWKAPRIDKHTMSLSEFPQMQHLAKLNSSTSFFLAGIAGRASRVCQLNSSPEDLLSGDTSSQTLQRVRMWLWLCFIDAHASMQNGRAASIDIAEALKVTRTFASMNDAPTDIELSALLEVASVYRTFHGSSKDDMTDLQALGQANAHLDSITKYWYQHHPRLVYDGAFVTQFIAPFHRLVINADVYRSWAVRNKAATEEQSGSPQPSPTLSHEEAKYLTIGVESAVTVLLYLTTNARADNGRRVPRFEEPHHWNDGQPIYKPMEPDADHARHIRTAVDTVVCVIIVFSAMFLAKLRAAGLMRCDLTVVTPTNPIKSYESDSHGRIALYSKFFRIIELAADFLEMVAPNSGHPCLVQSRVLRSLLSSSQRGTGDMSANSSRPSTGPGAGMSAQQPSLPPLPTHHQSQVPQQPSSRGPQTPSLPRYTHNVLGQPTLDHSANSPVASSDYPTHPPPPMSSDMMQQQHFPHQQQIPQQQSYQQHMQGVHPHLQNNQPDVNTQQSLNEMLTGIGQPGNPLVTSFLGGDEWGMLMTSLGLQQPSQ